MKKIYVADKEEIEFIKEVVSDILQFWSYSFIKVEDEHGGSIGMSKENFLKQIEKRLTNP